MSGNQPPGWFPDPAGEPHQRYWDGTQWTRETRDFPPPQVTESASSREERSSTSVPTTRLTPVVAPQKQSNRSGVWIVIAVLVGVALLGGGYALNRMQIDERAREAARQGANIGGTENGLRDMTNLLCPQGADTPAQEGVDCSRADLFR